MSSASPPQRKRPRREAGNHHKRNIELTGRAHGTPWKNFEEFESVGLALVTAAGKTTSALLPNDAGVCSDDQASDTDRRKSIHTITLEEALERVEIWKLRSQQLPQAIEATHALALCLWLDRFRNHSPSVDTTTLCLSYASAVIRCINGLTDVLQQTRSTAASVAHLSRLLGIPTWLVDVRHQATHNQLPSLSVLRAAATTLLQYLQQVYWDPVIRKRRERFGVAFELLNEYIGSSAECGNSSKSGVGRDKSKGTDKNVSRDDYAKLCDPSFYQGTTINRFAALRDNRKEMSEKSALQACTERKCTASSDTRTPSSLAQVYLSRVDLSPDILYESAVSSMHKCVLRNEHNTALNHANPLPKTRQASEGEPDTSVAFRSLVPLISTIAHDFPGFAPAMMVRLLEKALATAESTCTNTSGEMMATEWLDYFLSNAWRRRRNVASGSTGTSRTVAKSNLPLRALYDRYEHLSSPRTGTIVRRLKRSVQEGSIAQHNNNCEGLVSGATDSIFNSRSGKTEGEVVLDSLQDHAGMTLEEIESLIVEGNIGDTSSKGMTMFPKAECPATNPLEEFDGFPTASQTPEARPAWVLCDWWDACTIGTLPGVHQSS